MKMLTALLLAVALFFPAVAQKMTLSPGTHPRPKAAIVAPAIKPILLHTGKPITQNDKQQLLAGAIKAHATMLPVGAKMPRASVASSGSVTLTPDMMYKNGVAFAIAAEPSLVNLSGGFISFNPGASSNLIFETIVEPNTVYTLVITLSTAYMPQNSGTSPQFTISAGNQNPETFSGVTSGESQFAYSFTANSPGITPIILSSSNSGWWFISCEIIATPLN